MRIIFVFCFVCFFFWLKRLKKGPDTLFFLLGACVYVTYYIGCATSYYVLIGETAGKGSLELIILKGIILTGGIFLFIVCAVGIVYARRVVAMVKDREVIIAFVMLYVGLITALAIIYFGLYIIQPDWYIMNSNVENSAAALTFEFLYFSVVNTVTYSSDSIELVGIFPKTVHMIHILFFYLLAGNFLTSLFSTDKNYEDDFGRNLRRH